MLSSRKYKAYKNIFFQQEFIKAAGYPVDTHHLTTEDGYHLTLHRIPSKTTKSKPILLVHPMTTSGILWVVSLAPHAKPVAFVLSDYGYDIWILHHRGTRESLNHETLKSSDKNYWNFTLHELAIYDLGTSIEYVLDETGMRNINYFSYSQGSTCLMILLSCEPEFNQKISSAYLIAPIASFENVPLSVQIVLGSAMTRISFDFLESRGINYLALGDAKLYKGIEEIISSKLQTNIFLSGLSLLMGEFNQQLDHVRIFASKT